jgi:hypothetical protein
MNSGIYKFFFSSGHFYIGKSIHIDTRWDQHKKKMTTNKAAAPVQRCYDTYGMPTFEVLLDCHEDHIDILENIFISILHRDFSHIMLNTSIPLGYDQHYCDTILNNSDLLDLGTHEHILKIRTLEKVVQDLGSKTEEVDECDYSEEVLDLECYNTELFEKTQDMQAHLDHLYNIPFLGALLRMFKAPQKYA